MQNTSTALHDVATCIQRARQVLDTEIEALASTRDHLDERFAETIDLLCDTLKHKGKIVVTGVGKNLSIAEKMSATFASTGATSVVLNPVQAMHGDLGMLAEQDVLLALSFSGESEELLALMPAVRRLGVSIVGLAGRDDCSLATFCRILLPLHVPREACPFNMAPTASTTATLALGDALAMALLEARGFKKDDYARLHPAGAIGRTLLMRVVDVMRTGDRIAIIAPQAMVQDAIVAMTKAQAGAACVVTPDGRLEGIFTDGDLRRHLTHCPRALDMPMREAMTSNPICLEAHQLAVDVLRLFERHKIDDLPVVDDNGKLVGYVDIQDLPRLKIL